MIKNKEKRKIIWHNYYLKNRDRLLKMRQEWRLKNPEYLKKYEKERYAKNPEFHKKRHQEYSKNNREKVNKYIRDKYSNDLQFKFKCVLRSRLLIALKGKQKSDRTLKLIGCTIPVLKIHIENQFEKGMTWDNWEYYGWHIDHIIPISLFDLTNKEEVLKACHYTNLHPMWQLENQSKSNKIT